MQKSLLTLALTLALGTAAWHAAAQNAAKPDAGDALAAAQAKLAMDLIAKLADKGDPAVSPASLVSAFAVLGEGADDAMKKAMAQTLGFKRIPAAKAMAMLAQARAKMGEPSDSFQSADRIVFTPATPPADKLAAALKEKKIEFSIDDLSTPEAAAKVDAWVKEVTKGAIPEILGGPLDKASFVALNALHFKAKWKTPFDPALTAQASFKEVGGKGEDVAMMRLPAAERHFRTDRKGFIGIDLPFADPRFSLVVVTSTDAPRSAADFAAVGSWLSGAGFAPHKGDLALPKFSVAAKADLLPQLRQLGLDKGLKSKTALEAFGAGTMLSQVLQRTMMDVDEEGAEAAAATAAIVMRSLETDDSLHMQVDKPFIYALRDHATGMILVAGYVGHAPKGKA